jgi:helix-turn-helix protein
VTSIIVINSKDQFNYYLFIYLKLKVMSSKVVVLADATTGSVINVSNNPEFGHIRVEQTVNQYDDNGFLRRKI